MSNNTSITIHYVVHDDFGLYGSFTDRMDAVSCCVDRYREGHTVRLEEVLTKELDWQKDYKELCNG